MLLGLPMAESNPRKLIKRPNKPLGNAPLEIHGACCEYIKHIIDNGTFKTPACQTQAYNCLAQINDVLNGSDRVLNTPLPLAYSIALAQITWVYILIILGLALIGREIENPFGEDVNDLALDDFCNQIEQDVNIIMTYIPGSMPVYMEHPDNNLLYPLASGKYEDLLAKSPEYIRSRLHTRAFGRTEASS
jgi:putative membrane protein